jgi:hypothetical protein
VPVPVVLLLVLVLDAALKLLIILAAINENISQPEYRREMVVWYLCISGGNFSQSIIIIFISTIFLFPISLISTGTRRPLAVSGMHMEANDETPFINNEDEWIEVE